MLDFPRPLPISISFTGELGRKKENRDGENTIITVLTLHICRTKLPMSRCSLQKRDCSLLFHALSPLLSVHNPCFIIKQKHVDICRKCDILPFSSHNLSRTSQLDNWKHEKGIDRVLAWNCFQYDKHAQNYDCKLNIKSCVRSIIVQKHCSSYFSWSGLIRRSFCSYRSWIYDIMENGDGNWRGKRNTTSASS